MKSTEETRRISISLPATLQEALDGMLQERGFDNRSQAIAEMIRSELTLHHMDDADQVMAGTITLFYDETRPRLQRQIADLQRQYVAEVISSQHVLLEAGHRMEILVVQGPMARLQEIVHAFLRVKGVKTGKLSLSPRILPPVHAKVKPAAASKRKKKR